MEEMMEKMKAGVEPMALFKEMMEKNEGEMLIANGRNFIGIPNDLQVLFTALI